MKKEKYGEIDVKKAYENLRYFFDHSKEGETWEYFWIRMAKKETERAEKAKKLKTKRRNTK
jgi:hypothetical protein